MRGSRAYVYRLVDPRTGLTFYVGKGRNNRAFAHLRLAITGEPGLRHDRIRQIRALGHEPRLIVHRHGLTDEVAHEVEAALIDIYAGEDLDNEVRGHNSDRGMMTAYEVAAMYGASPADIPVPAILIKIEREWHDGLSPEQLYERTRRYWRCNPEARRPPPRFALSVARGLIREVYEIDRWETYPDMSRIELDPTRLVQVRRAADQAGQARRGFVGGVTSDQDLRRSLVGKGVRHVAFGSGSPIAYVNCGKPAGRRMVSG